MSEVDISPEAAKRAAHLLDVIELETDTPKSIYAAVLTGADVIRAISDALTAAEKQRSSAVDCVLDIAAMGKKTGSEMAKHRLAELGIDWQTGDPLPNYRSMT